MARLFYLLLTLTVSLPAATYVLNLGGTTSSAFLGQPAGSAWSVSAVFDPANLNVFGGASYEADSPGDISAVLTIGALTGTATVSGNFFIADASGSGNDEWWLNLYPFFPGAGGPYWAEIVLRGGPNVWSSTALPLDNSLFQQLTVSRQFSIVDSCFSCTSAQTTGSVTSVNIQPTPEPASSALVGAGLAIAAALLASRKGSGAA